MSVTSPLSSSTVALARFTPAEVDRIAGHMARRIVGEITLPRQFRRIGYLRSILVACREGLRALVRQLQDGGGLRSADMQRLGWMGAKQAEMGVPLEVILSAYRLAAKVVWQELISQADGLDQLAPQTVVHITGQVLEYLDEISGAVGASYLETRERLMRQRDRERDRLLHRLLAGDAGADWRRLAAAADLTLSPPYLVAACAADSAAAEAALESEWRPAGALLVADRPGIWLALLPAGTDVAALLRATGAGLWLATGPLAQNLDDVAGAARQARETLETGMRVYPERRLYRDSELWPFISLARNPERTRQFVNISLGPLSGPGKAKYRELRETLEILLDSENLAAAAVRLGVHRHTVVYRVRRLRELGIKLDSGDERQQLWLALRASRLLDPRPAE